MSDGSERSGPPDALSGRDVELVAVGLLCLAVAGWTITDGGFGQLGPTALLVALALCSFGLAIWDVQSRAAGPDD